VIAYYWMEVAQLVFAFTGLCVALSEWSAMRDLGRVGKTPAQKVLARHAARIELMRMSVHVAILLSAFVSLALPEPPRDVMPGWMITAVGWRKIGFVWVAFIATAGTVSSRVTRRRVAGLLRDAA
jgi:hypothetical protein